MMYKFYGLTAANIVFCNFSPNLYRRCLEYYISEPVVLAVLDKQFEEMIDFLEELPVDYLNIEDKKTRALILRKKKMLKGYEDSEQLSNDDLATIDSLKTEIVSLEKQLEGKPKAIPRTLIIKGESHNLSEVSREIIGVLLNNIDMAKRYRSLISIQDSDEVNEVFFNKPLYQLNKLKRPSLYYNLQTVLPSRNKKNDGSHWKLIDSFTKCVFAKVSDKSSSTENLMEKVIEETRRELINFDLAYLTDRLNSGRNLDNFLEVTLEDLYKASLELHDVGLRGFCPYVQELFQEFENNHVPAYKSEVNISKDSELYQFAVMLKRSLDSNLKFGEDL